jgi:hypothetical protein
VLLLLGHYRTALGTALIVAALVISFSVFLMGIGLPPLPSSTLTKSALLAAGSEMQGTGTISAIAKNITATFSRKGGRMLVALLVLVIARPVVTRSFSLRSPEVLLAGFALTLTAAHLVAGRYGWQSRYELYAIFALLAAALYQWRDFHVRCVEKTPRSRRAWALVLLPLVLLIVGFPYLRTTVRAPFAANNIYEQQYQMHRFVTAFHTGPVAVNDLGWVAYRNPSYVLDLWGLGSEAARRALLSGDTQRTFGALAERHGVTLAIVFPLLEKKLPVDWIPLARLHLSRNAVAVPAPVVVFYATQREAEPTLRARIDAFATTLPPGVRLERN